jgi:hypothetical protein
MKTCNNDDKIQHHHIFNNIFNVFSEIIFLLKEIILIESNDFGKVNE